MKRVLILVLSLMMAVGTVTGCAKQTPSSSTGSTESTASAESDKTSEPIDLSMLTLDQQSQYSLKDTPNYKALQKVLLEKFNVNLTCEFGIAKNYEETVTTRLSSNDLPDTVNISFDMAKVVQLYQSGVLLKLNDLIAKNAPDIQKAYGEKPLLKIANSDSDGNLLRVCSLVENPQHRFQVMNLRNDWLKKIGKTYEDIKTPDDLYNALKAFQDKDMNGNGQKDEFLTCWNASQLGYVLGTAFGAINITTASKAWYADKDGKIYNTLTTDNTKAFCTFAHKLYAEGLLDNNYESQTGDEYNQKQYNNQMAANIDAWWGAQTYTDAMVQKGFEDCDMIQLARPLSVDNKPMTNCGDLAGYGGFMITKACKDPDRMMQVLNYGYTLEGTQLNYYGEVAPGGNYYQTVKNCPEGVKLPDYYMEYTEKYKTEYANDSLLWDKMGWNSQILPLCMIGNMEVIAFNNTVKEKEDKLTYTYDFNYAGLKEASETTAVPAVNFATATADQLTKLAEYGDLWTYMNEMFSKFVNGTESLDNWDAFVAKCKDMGIDKATAIYQDMYDSYLKIMKE